MFLMQEREEFTYANSSVYFNTYTDGTCITVEARGTKRYVMFSQFFWTQRHCVIDLETLLVAEREGFNDIEVCSFLTWCHESYQQLMTVAYAIA